MRTLKLLTYIGCTLIMGSLLSCQDEWDSHYSRAKMVSKDFIIWSGDIESYIKSQPELTAIDSVLDTQGMYKETATNKGYTFIVCDNEAMAKRISGNDASFARNCVSDISIDPTKLTNEFGLVTRLGKNVWVYVKDGETYLDDYKLVKKIKADNGYIYYVSGVIPIRKSVYQLVKGLGPDYSTFVSLVERYEETYFDKESSTPTGVDKMGNTTYDSVMSARNTLMDRYTSEGLPYWNMRSESFLSTVFIPTNEQISHAIAAAMDSIPLWLGREATEDDRTKFEKWIVTACFVNKRLTPAEVSATAPDFRCIAGCQQMIDQAQDSKSYEEVDPACWRPSVQTVDVNNGIALSNGVAYYLTNFKIPNHVVIYRVKAKFYELWGAMTDAQKKKYFRWTNWVDPIIINDAQSPFTLSATLPTMYYHVLAAIPSAQAIKDSAVCSVTYDGVLYNSTTDKISEVHLPAGEYYLRMGFKHSLRYSISIWFNKTLLVKDMVLYAQGSNFHFDRGSVSILDYYGTSTIGYPEGFDWRSWIEKDPKAVAYDTDGYQVAIVNLPKSGNFTITIDSNDESYLYDPTNLRSKNNVTQLMMYHWCLRPTSNNY